MRGYLLDTQIIAYWFDGASGQFPLVEKSVNALAPEVPLYMSGITLGEIEYGHWVNPAGAGVRRDNFVRFLREKLPQVAAISRHTAEPYGKIRACLVEKFAPKKGWGNKRRAEQLCDPLTALQLGIDENDLWLVAQSIERNLTFVTHDNMDRICEAVEEMFPDFLSENWCRAED